MLAQLSGHLRRAAVITGSEHVALVRELLAGQGLVTMRATGGSMMPALFHGDLLEVRAASSGELRVGDLVLARQQEMLRAHRLVGWTARGELRLRGDNLAREDPPLALEHVLGRATLIPPRRLHQRVARLLRRLRWRLARATAPANQ